MITTLTTNTTVDQTLFVDSFQFNRTMRATQTAWSMGGKPTDASWILGELGIPSLALGFAAGPMRAKLEALLHQRGVLTDFVACSGETRVNTVIVSQDGQGQATITTNTLEVLPEHLDALRARYFAALDQATVIVTGGTLPRGVEPSLYKELISAAHERNIPIIFDADQPNLGVGLQAHPTYIKPNQHELEALTGRPIPDLAAAYQAGRAIVEQYGTYPIITLGEIGGLAVLADRAYHIPPLNVEVVSTSGAGDGVLAGLAASVHRGQPIEEGLRLGFAAAAAVLLQPGTADCRKADVERFLPQIELIPYP